MGIALFVIALVSNIFTILIVRFGFIGNYEYKQGMILGSTRNSPASAAGIS